MSFIDIATPLASLGIRVFPLQPGLKVPPAGMDFLDKATTDPNQLSAWNRDNSNYNVAILADDNFCFLEFDVVNGMKDAAAEMGHSVPMTRIQKSGGGYGHFIFRHSDRSRKLGNRSVNLRCACICDKQQNLACRCGLGGLHHHHEWFSYRAMNKYLVGAGSRHPDGGYYKHVVDADPIPMPEWVCDFVEKHSMPLKPPTKREMSDLSEDFDFDDFLDFYGIGGRQDGDWFITDECPVSGHKHKQSFRTGFFFDGGSLGFHCFAQGCDGSNMSIGQVIAHLNKEKGENYTGVIWDKEDADPEDGDMDIDFDDPLMATRSVNPGMVDGKLLSLDARLVEAEPSVTLQEEPEAYSVPTLTEMPEEAMYGKLKQYAIQMAMPRGLAYPALLGCYSVIPNRDEMGEGTRINTYVALLGVVGGGKNTAIKRARIMLDIPEGMWSNTTMVSDRGLMNVIGDQPPKKRGGDRVKGPKKVLILTNEMNDVIRKMAVQNSTLATTLCDLWDENQKTIADRQGGQSCDCRLSWVGGIPVNPESPEEFAELFSRETAQGMVSRLIYGYSSKRFNFKPWKKPSVSIPVTEDEVFTDLAVNTGWSNPAFTPDVYAMADEWQPEEDDTGRLRYNLFKVALLTASANGDREVTVEGMQAAIVFMEWQRGLKQVFKPGEAVGMSDEAKFNEVLLNALEAKGAAYEYVNWKRLMYDRKWMKKFTARVIHGCVDNLIKLRVLTPHLTVTRNEESGRPEKKENKNLVMLHKAMKKDGGKASGISGTVETPST
jgi:Bifunctional DNA primase/polymerase, N-terminal